MFQISLKVNGWIIAITILAFLIRVAWIDFPKFTADEARIAYRGYTLITEGRDELGRVFPFIFNSSQDYQLPLTTYFTALGIGIFGKNDYGARLPFILLGTMIVVISYKIAQFFNPRKEFCLLVSAIVAFSPGMIFFSKVPNESLVLTIFVMLLFYLLAVKRFNLRLIVLVIILSLITSKFSWFIIPIFVPFVLFFFTNSVNKRIKIRISLLVICMSISLFLIYFNIPQGKRSLIENNFSLFQDTSVTNGIDKLRGQGLESGGLPFIEKSLFNKTHFISIGFLNWLSQIQAYFFFGKFDEKNIDGFVNAGSLQKILIIPFLAGLFYILNNIEKKYLFLLISIGILTYPLIFAAPFNNLKSILSVIPFLAIITVFGFIHLKKFLRVVIIILFMLELGFMFLNMDMSTRIAQYERPTWIQEVTRDGLKRSGNLKIAFSDDLASDMGVFVQWYMGGKATGLDGSITFPYKFRQTKIGSIKIIGSNSVFYKCGDDSLTSIIASKRDVSEINRWLNVKTDLLIKKTYTNDRGEAIAYFFDPTICVH